MSNILFTLPRNATSGISSFAYTVGLRPQDLFPVCLTLFLSIIAATVVLSLFIWVLESALTFIIHVRSNGPPESQYGPTRNAHYANKDSLDHGVTSMQTAADEEHTHSSHFLFNSSKFTQSPRKRWFRLRPDFSSFHFTVLQGNLVRILMLFHLPVTIFSSYQLTIGREATALSIAFAALSLVAFSIVIPILLIFRLFMNSTSKLYDETWTLLALGPLYNHYRHGSQLFACIFFATSLASGVTIGCGQKSGIAQAVIILLIEVITALVTSIWLPWGHGASMGLISFLFCVARIVVAVLLVILTPTVSVLQTDIASGPNQPISVVQVSIGTEASQWVAYVILLIIGIVYLALVLLLTTKIIEGVTRIVGGIGFDRSRHTVDTGLLGVCGLLGCCGSRKRSSPRHRAKHSDLPKIASQTTLPLTGPKDSTPTQSAPPSVFRPEHALRPYREENDDDTGYIMGAWRPFPRPGYAAVGDQGTPPESPSKSGTGFSRIGGGRSHFDTPYSIATGSAYTFPSASLDLPPTPQRHSHESNPSVTPSFANAERQPYPSLPPGALAPHVRRKSQSAVIEHVPAPPKAPAASSLPSSQLAINVPSSYRRQSQLSEVVSPVTDDDSPEVSQPKKRYWFQLRKPRRHSAGNEARLGEEVLADKPADTGRSFVVLRDRKPSQPLASGSGSGSGTGEAPDAPPAKSFVVLRGKDNPPTS
jgi:Transient receptor potential (TRP) ion channel